MTITVTSVPDAPRLPAAKKTHIAYSDMMLCISAAGGLLAGVVDPDKNQIYVLDPESLSWDAGILTVNRDGSFTFDAVKFNEPMPLNVSCLVVDSEGNVSAWGTFNIIIMQMHNQI